MPLAPTVTHKVRSKKRFARVDDSALIKALQTVGKRLAGDARAGAAAGRLLGIYALPGNKVMELYEVSGQPPVAFVFASLDVWMSFSAEDLAAAD